MSAKSKRAIFSACLALAALATTGCYREVVSAKGIGADAHYPQRVQTKESPIDNALDPLLNPLLGPNPNKKSD